MKSAKPTTECYFSRFVERASWINTDYSYLKLSNDFLDLDDEDVTSNFRYFQDNTTVRISENSKILEFSGKGGTQMEINVESSITGLFRLKEGILIEFEAKRIHTLDDLYSISEYKGDLMDEENNEFKAPKRYSYAVLNFHPHDVFRTVFLNVGDQCIPWLDQTRKIQFFDDNTSIAVVYNTENLNHEIISFATCFAELKKCESEIAPFEKCPIYSLGPDLLGKQAQILPSYFANIIYSGSEQFHAPTDPLTDCKIIHTQNYAAENAKSYGRKFRKELIICMLMKHVVERYSVCLTFDAFQVRTRQFMASKATKLDSIGPISRISSFRMVHVDNSFVSFAEYLEKGISESTFFKKSSFLSSQPVVDIDDSRLLSQEDLEGWATYQSNFEVFKQIQLEDCLVTIDFERQFALYYGEKKIICFELSPRALSRLNAINWQFYDIINGEVILQELDSQQDRCISIGKVIPEISCSKVCSFLQIASITFDYLSYIDLISDVLINSSMLSNNIIPRGSSFASIPSCCFRNSSADPFQRLTYYITYLLKAIESGSETALDMSNENRAIKSSVKIRSNQVKSPDLPFEKFKAVLTQNSEFLELQDFLPDLSYRVEPVIFERSGTKLEKEFDVLPIVKSRLGDFQRYKVTLFKRLHLLFEDLKLDSTMGDNKRSLGFFLFAYTTYLGGEHHENYLDYYSRDHPNFPFQFNNDEIFPLIDSVFNNSKTGKTTQYEHIENSEFWSDELEENPFSIESTIRMILRVQPKSPYIFPAEEKRKYPLKNIKQYPVLFKTSHFVLKFLAIKYLQGRKPYFKAIREGDIFGSEPRDSTYPSFPISKGNYIKEEGNRLLRKLTLTNTLKEAKQIHMVRISDRILLYFISQKITTNYLDTLIPSLEKILRQSITLIKSSLPGFMFVCRIPKRAFVLLGRLDIYMNKTLYAKVRNSSYREKKSHRKRKSSISFGTPSFLSEKRQGHDDTFYQESLNSHKENIVSGSHTSQDPHMISILNSNYNYKSSDSIYKETLSLLDINGYIKIRTTYLKDCPESEISHQLLIHLRKLALRRLSCMVGRAAFGISSSKTILSDKISIPKIRLSAVYEKDLRKVTLDRTNQDISEMTNWPKFHNGVGIGMEISREMVGSLDNETLRTWIKYQKLECANDSLEYENPGLILGFGLQGMLDSLLATDIYTYLKEYKEVMSIALLLGLAASRLGTKEPRATKAFCIHVHCLLPSISELKIGQLVESSALLSLGLLYAKSANQQYSEIMLRQIPARPVLEHNPYRECYSLSAGFALGLINLGRGNTISSNNDMRLEELEERMLIYINGGRQKSPIPKSRFNTGFEYKNSNILESDFVNTQLTAPSALSVLALVYMKTERVSLAKSLTIPETLYEVGDCNPNIILLKSCTRNMIMWSKIVPTRSYVEDQIPQLVKLITKGSYEELKQTFPRIEEPQNIDFSGISLIYYNSIAGGIMALGLKFAGTGDKDAKKLILDYIDELLLVQIIANDFVCDIEHKGKLDPYYLFNILSVCMISASIVMAGTADIDCLKKARIIRKHLQFKDIESYGFNMAIHMAIGFLSLGKGGYTFGREDIHIAALFISIFPHFPVEPNDNKYHLQAYRHLYALAVVPNLFHAIDIEKNKSETVNIEVYIREEKNPTAFSTPTYLKGVANWTRVRLISPEYYQTDFIFDSVQENDPPRMLFIKKRIDRRVDLKCLKRTIEIDKFEKRLSEKDLDAIFQDYYLGSLCKLYIDEKHGTGLIFSDSDINFLCGGIGCLESNLKEIKANMHEQREKARAFQISGSLLLKIIEKLMIKENLAFLEDYLEYIYADERTKTFGFSRIPRLLDQGPMAITNHLIVLDYFMYNRMGIQNGSEEDNIAENGLCRVLNIHKQLKELEANEITQLRKMASKGLKFTEFAKNFVSIGAYKKYVAKQRLLNLGYFKSLQNFSLYLNKLRDSIRSQEPDFDENLFWLTLEKNNAIQKLGLGSNMQRIFFN